MIDFFETFKLQNVAVLPACSRPFKEEVLSSWLARLANDHGLKLTSFISLISPEAHKISIISQDIDRISCDSSFIKELSLRTHCSKEQIFETTLRSYTNKLFFNYVPFPKWILPCSFTWASIHEKKYGDLYCPKCLTEDGNTPYLRKYWKLAFAFVCTGCGNYLNDKCAYCHCPVSFVRNVIGGCKSTEPIKNMMACYNCKRDLRRGQTTAAFPDLIALQNELNRIMNEGLNEKNKCPHLYFDVLNQIIKLISCTISQNSEARLTSFHQDLSETFMIPLINRKSKNDGRRFEFMNFEDRLSLIMMAHWLLEDWPNRFLFYCKKYKLRYSTILHSFENAPAWFKDVINQELRTMYH